MISSHAFKAKVIHFLESHPYKIGVAALLLFACLLPGIQYIVSDYTYKVWYNDEDPLMKRFKVFESKFGNDDGIAIGIEAPEGIFDRDVLQAIRDITEELWSVKHIIRVDSLTNHIAVYSENDEIESLPLVPDEIENLGDNQLQQMQKKALDDPMLKDFVLSKDGRYTIIDAKIVPSSAYVPDNTLIMKEVLEKIKKFEGKEKYHLFYSGSVPLSYSFRDASERDLSFIFPMILVALSVILYFIFRTVTGFLYPMIIVGTTIGSTLGVFGYFGFTLNSLSSVIPTIILTVALADTIHILTSFNLAQKKGYDKASSIHYSLDKNFYPTLLTSFTTFIGFISFSKSEIEVIAELGLSVGIGVILAWLYSYSIMVSLLFLRPVKAGGKRDLDLKSLEHTFEVDSQNTSKERRFLHFLTNSKFKVVLVTAFLGVVGTYYCSQLKVNMNPYDQFHENHFIVRAKNKIVEYLGGSGVVEIKINQSEENKNVKDPLFLQRVQEFQNWLEGDPHIFKTVSIVDIVKNINKVFHNNQQDFFIIPESQKAIAENIFFYTLGLPQGKELTNRISLDEKSIRITGLWSVEDSTTALHKISEIENQAKKFHLDAKVTGKLPLFHELTPKIVGTFLNSFLFAFICITLTLIISLKSLKLGLLALIPNILPLILGGALYYLAGQHVDIGSVIIASVCLGIAVDDSIHLLFEYQKHRRRGIDTIKSLGIIVHNTFPALFFTTFILNVGFGMIVFSDYVPNVKFGIMVSIILFMALIADFIVLPIILLFLDKNRKNEGLSS
ncbi:MAG: MMPL family transporter [Halobacteriovoraceae bacterium]|nr:MMPL family transporter [Halobacteriovoraceae bacterium]MCB9094043.1 MMPL family transporter [Halobacteriovoraceae bacterium]